MTLQHDIVSKRIYSMLSESYGEKINQWLADPDVVEVILNPDGKLWVDRLSSGLSNTGEYLPESEAERIIRIISNHVGRICDADNPLISASLPETGERFQGVLPPIVEKPAFTIRKKAVSIFSIDDYIKKGIMTPNVAARIRKAVREKENIIISGGTGSGKTTLGNAVLNEIAKTGDRLVIIEDTAELQCSAKDYTQLLTKDGVCTMRDLLKATLRLRPDRIIIGEVRGAEALDLLKAWNTGHPGGCSTLHANSAEQALDRFEQLIQEASISVPQNLIATAVNLIVHIQKEGNGRRIKELVEVLGYKPTSGYILSKKTL